MAEDLPVFDDEWVASARHSEQSVDELKRTRRTERRAVRRRKLRRVVMFVGVVAAVVGIGVYVARTPGNRGTSVGSGQIGDADRVWSDQASGANPTPSEGEGSRLLPEVARPDSESGYSFTAVRDDGSPVTYDPCRPVEFVVNPAGAPEGYRTMLNDALEDASEATGLALRLTDTTDEPATPDRAQFQPDRYGDRWAPVLIAWTDAAVIPELAGDTAGIGGSAWIKVGSDPAWYVSGILYVDRDLGDDPIANRSVILHELGHVLGLDHVDDPSQIMYPEGTVDAFASGDLAGLARVGAGDCADPI